MHLGTEIKDKVVVGKFSGYLKSFKVVWKVLRLSEKFSGCLERSSRNLEVVWKVLRLSGNFSDCLEVFYQAL